MTSYREVWAMTDSQGRRKSVDLEQLSHELMLFHDLTRREALALIAKSDELRVNGRLYSLTECDEVPEEGPPSE